MGAQYRVPVAVIVFNRVELAKKMLKCLEKIQPEQLFVISDGAREHVSGEKEKVEKVRALFEEIPWPCKVYKNYADQNMGCDNRVPSGIDWVFGQVEQAVILEDDCIPSDDFFRYSENMLERYKDNHSVMMIAGSNYMQNYKMRDCCCFSARVYTWGWATWKRAWECYNEDEEVWKQIKKDGTLAQIYPFRIRHFVKKELDYYYERGKCPWDYLWWVSCMRYQGLCAVPSVNLISNQGFGEDATHTQDQGSYDGQTYSMEFPLKYPARVERDHQIDKYDWEINRPWLIVRAMRKLMRIVKSHQR
ncbi:MAG: hypothetical protein KH452_03365 [Clostridiales bacterium]|nr:hypothetical protein [Clostridiales bacterium]